MKQQCVTFFLPFKAGFGDHQWFRKLGGCHVKVLGRLSITKNLQENQKQLVILMWTCTPSEKGQAHYLNGLTPSFILYQFLSNLLFDGGLAQES